LKTKSIEDRAGEGSLCCIPYLYIETNSPLHPLEYQGGETQEPFRISVYRPTAAPAIAADVVAAAAAIVTEQ
jgi:hypothetical protein